MNRRFTQLVVVSLAALITVSGQAADGDAIALANGKPIAREAVVNLLLESHGIEALQQIVLLDLAKQEAQKRGTKVSSADVQREYDTSVDKLAASVAPGEKLDDATRRRALDALLEQKGISRAEFMLTMERNAYLRKMVAADFKISELTLREEFARTFGERVQIRDIVLTDGAELAVVLDSLNKGADFAEVARARSRHPSASDGGQLPPFAFDDDSLPALLREAAFSLKVGEVSSPLRVDERIHVIKLERRIPPENVKFEDVRAQVEEKLRDRVLPQEMSKLAADLFEKAQIRVLEPKLRDRFEEFRKQATAEHAK